MTDILESVRDSYTLFKSKGKDLATLKSRRTFLDDLFKGKKVNSGEYLYLLHLDKENRLRNFELLKYSVGDYIELDIKKDVIFKILNSEHPNIILTHNHPNQDSEPSFFDMDFTYRVKLLSDKLKKNLLDHLIWTGSGVFSFEQKNMIQANSMDEVFENLLST